MFDNDVENDTDMFDELMGDDIYDLPGDYEDDIDDMKDEVETDHRLLSHVTISDKIDYV